MLYNNPERDGVAAREGYGGATTAAVHVGTDRDGRSDAMLVGCGGRDRQPWKKRLGCKVSGVRSGPAGFPDVQPIRERT